MKLIVGLGNPDREYAGTRHNIGFMCVAHFAKSHRITLDKKQCRARVGMGEVAATPVVLARPQTYMNASGASVRQLLEKYKVDLSDLIVIHDDLDLPLGKLRIRLGGGSGGHKGIKSIIAEVGSPDFIRVRVGIGRPPSERSETIEEDIIGYVLTDFTPDEKAVVKAAIEQVSEAILCLLTDGLQAAMNWYN